MNIDMTLLWFQSFPNKWQAFKVERQLKGWSRRKKLAMIAGKWDLVKMLRRGKTS
jgi:predicted GIY-YIG superfamily endonuclease